MAETTAVHGIANCDTVKRNVRGRKNQRRSAQVSAGQRSVNQISLRRMNQGVIGAL